MMVIANAGSRLFRSRTRIYAHRTAAVDGLIRGAGLEPRFLRSTIFWQVAVYERPAVA